MNNTLKYVAKKSLRWIWLILMISALLTLFLLHINNFRGNMSEQLKKYDNDWELYPEAERAAIFVIESKDEISKTVYLHQLTPIDFYNNYVELVVQRLSSVEYMQKLYRSLITKYPELFNVITVDYIKKEMISIEKFDSTTIVISVKFNLKKESDQLSYAKYEIRDYLFSEYIMLIEKDEIIDNLPIKLNRAELLVENSFAEQKVLSEVFSASTIDASSISISIKTLFVFCILTCIGYFLCYISILCNGVIKTAEEVEMITNLDVYDEMISMNREAAVEIIKTKLDLDHKKELILLFFDHKAQKEEEEFLVEKLGGIEVKIVRCIENEESVQHLSNKEYLLMIRQDTTEKKALALYAKELSKINAKCLGAIMMK